MEFLLLLSDVLKKCLMKANSADPDQMSHTVASDLGLHSLPRLVCSNTQSK